MLFFIILNLFFQSEVLEYKLYWAGIEAGFLTLKFEDCGETIETNMKSYTTGLVKKFYYMEDEASSIIRKKDLQTLFYKKTIRERKKYKEESTIFFPEEKIYFSKYFKEYDFFSTDTLSIFYLLRFKKDLKSPLKVYEKGKFYEVYIEEEKNYLFSYKDNNLLTNKIVLKRKDKEKSNIVIYILEKNNNVPVSIEFSFPLGLLRAILQCY